MNGTCVVLLLPDSVTRNWRQAATRSASTWSRMYFLSPFRKDAVSLCARHFPFSKMASAPKCFVALKASISLPYLGFLKPSAYCTSSCERVRSAYHSMGAGCASFHLAFQRRRRNATRVEWSPYSGQSKYRISSRDD